MKEFDKPHSGDDSKAAASRTVAELLLGLAASGDAAGVIARVGTDACTVCHHIHNVGRLMRRVK